MTDNNSARTNALLEAQTDHKSVGLAYVLLIFLGTLGIHRFYIGHSGIGITQLILTIVGWATSWLLIGFIPLGIVWIWVIVDLFLLHGDIKKVNTQTNQKYFARYGVV